MTKNIENIKIITILTLLLSLFYLNSCGIYKPVDAREYPPDPKLRVKKNLEEGRGFRLSGGQKREEYLILQAQMNCGEQHLIR